MKPFGLPYEGPVFLVSWSRVNKPVGRIEGCAEPLALVPVRSRFPGRRALRGAMLRG